MAPAHPATAGSEVTINADADKIYALLTDLPTLSALAEETESMSWLGADSAARAGARFKGDNRNGKHKWSTTCTVTDAEPGRVFAFDVKHTVMQISHWRYDIEPVDGGCRVSERTWDRRPKWFQKPAGMATGVADRTSVNEAHIKATLQRLKDRAEQSA